MPEPTRNKMPDFAYRINSNYELETVKVVSQPSTNGYFGVELPTPDGTVTRMTVSSVSYKWTPEEAWLAHYGEAVWDRLRCALDVARASAQLKNLEAVLATRIEQLAKADQAERIAENRLSRGLKGTPLEGQSLGQLREQLGVHA